MSKECLDNEKFARKCDITGEGMNEGFYINDEIYMKNDIELLRKYLSEKTDYKDEEEAFNDEYYYFTEWDDLEDYQYQMINGVLIEIIN